MDDAKPGQIVGYDKGDEKGSKTVVAVVSDSGHIIALHGLPAVLTAMGPVDISHFVPGWRRDEQRSRQPDHRERPCVNKCGKLMRDPRGFCSAECCKQYKERQRNAQKGS